tara:strand:- start:91219 stop:91917 length:699 start_codon:yes stop_codon:yes gene_type:complete
MMTLYIANKNYSSWSLRPWVLMRELNIAFEEKLFPFEEGSSWDTFRTFSPSGKVPCLADGDTTLWDSMGIAEYLAEQHPQVWPADAAARAWARCAAAEMHAGFGTLRDVCSMNVGLRIRLHDMSAALQRDLHRLDELWTEGLTRFGGPFLAGSKFTNVDAFFAPVAFRIQTYGLPLSGPAQEYAGTLLALESMQQWERESLLEPWLDEEHEALVEVYGTRVSDLRTGTQSGK